MTRPPADLVVLAYSGGLDTTVTVHRLVHEQGRAVVALLADVGQGEDLPALAERALAAAADAVVVDAWDRFAAEFLVPAVRANALYEGRYPLVSALSRPLIAQLLVEEARRRGLGRWPTAAPARATTRSGPRSAARPGPGAGDPGAGQGLGHEPAGGDRLRRQARPRPWRGSPRRRGRWTRTPWGRTIEAGVLEDPLGHRPRPPSSGRPRRRRPPGPARGGGRLRGRRAGDRRRSGGRAGRGGGRPQPPKRPASAWST